MPDSQKEYLPEDRPDPKEWPTVQKLVEALEEFKEPNLQPVIERAKQGEFHDYLSTNEMPLMDLSRAVRKAYYPIANKFTLRILDGEFDATTEEAELWFEKVGKFLIAGDLTQNTDLKNIIDQF